MSTFRIEYTVTCSEDGESFEEIGFGSSGEWDTLDQAAHMVASSVQSGEWEDS